MNINGLEFTDEVPTNPGAYWWNPSKDSAHTKLVERYDASGRLFGWFDGKGYTDSRGCTSAHRQRNVRDRCAQSADGKRLSDRVQ